jgi:hypothetical protein
MNQKIFKPFFATLLLMTITVYTESSAQAVSEPNGINCNVDSFNAKVQSDSVLIIESPNHLKYDSPYFTANATVRCTTRENERVNVGFIQQVDYKSLVFDYGDAYISIELPYTPVSDALWNHRPWYDKKNSQGMRVIEGGGNHSVEISMSDSLGGEQRWQVPPPILGNCDSNANRFLHGIKLDEVLTSWLVVKRESDGFIKVLKKVTWHEKMDISVNMNRPLGLRTTINPVPKFNPEIMDGDASMIISDKVLNGLTITEIKKRWWNSKQAGSCDKTLYPL